MNMHAKATEQKSAPPEGLDQGAAMIARLEVDAPLPVELTLHSIAVSLVGIRKALESIQSTLHTGNLGQGNNLSTIAQNTKNIEDRLYSVVSGVNQLATAKVTAMEKALRAERGW